MECILPNKFLILYGDKRESSLAVAGSLSIHARQKRFWIKDPIREAAVFLVEFCAAAGRWNGGKHG